MPRSAGRLIAALALGALVELASGLPAGLAAADLMAGVALLMGRRPLSRVAGVAWFAGDLAAPLVYVHRGPLFHLIAGTRSRAARVVVGAAYLDGLVPPLARSPWPTVGLSAALVAVAWPHRRRWAALAVGGTLAVAAALRLLQADHDSLLLVAYCAAVAAVGIGRRRRGLVGLVIDLGAHYEPYALRAALRRALGDPSLRVLYRLGDGTWADEAGTRARIGEQDRVTYVGADAALIHDPGVVAGPRTLRVVQAAVEMALANARLHADIADRLRELEASRRRLVEAADDERRRVVEAVEAGPVGRLAAVARQLEGDPLAAQAERARAQLRHFAQGLHPRELSEHGLRAALAERTAAGPVPVRLDVPERRFAPAQEATLYFVAAEALANVAKHAHAGRAEITLRAQDGHVVLTVADDGIGGADVERGTGLRGLADRAEALGGTLRVERGAGTRVRVELPL